MQSWRRRGQRNTFPRLNFYAARLEPNSLMARILLLFPKVFSHQGTKTLANQPASSRAPRSQEGSFITAGSVLEGKLAFAGPTMLSAHLKGDISTDSLLVVEAGAVIEGNVSGTVIIVHGEIKGSVSASETIEAWPGCRLEGRAYAPSMRVEEGANILADLLIAPQQPADWFSPVEDPASTPAIAAPHAPVARPTPPFVNTMFSPPEKSVSGS
ncbi:MAG: cytoskeletal protein CcmA (bactofilin family) [Hyphomonas sp.]|jgi:cytoskeletal protein CcmA (bactofilin family)